MDKYKLLYEDYTDKYKLLDENNDGLSQLLDVDIGQYLIPTYG